MGLSGGGQASQSEALTASEPREDVEFTCEQALYQCDNLVAVLYKDSAGDCVGSLAIRCGGTLHHRRLRFVAPTLIGLHVYSVYSISDDGVHCANGLNPKRFIAFERNANQGSYHIYLSKFAIVWWPFSDNAKKFPF